MGRRHLARKALFGLCLLPSYTSVASAQSEQQEQASEPIALAAAEEPEQAPASPDDAAATAADADAAPAAPEQSGSHHSDANPYGGRMEWESQHIATPPPTVAPEDETPQTTVESQERVVPTSDLNTRAGEHAKPFSVGGITAKVSDETWFKFFGFMQTRFLSHWNKRGEGDRQAGGFNIARARVFFYGRMLDWLSILLRAGATNNGSLGIEQAYADFRYKNFTFRVGQWYLPLFQEQLPSPDSTLTINPSAVGGVFDGGQVQGLRALWDLGQWRIQASSSNGMRTAFSEVGSKTVAKIAVSSRVETIIGEPDFSRFSTGSSFRGQKTAILLGASAHYQVGGSATEESLSIAQGSADATLESNGWNLHLSLALNSTNTDDGDGVLNVGGVAQMGYFVWKWTEFYARYEALVSNPTSQNTDDSYSVFRGMTAGFSQYFWPERGLRAQLDYVYYPDGINNTPIVPNSNAGIFATSGAQWALRAQLNLIF